MGTDPRRNPRLVAADGLANGRPIQAKVELTDPAGTSTDPRNIGGSSRSSWLALPPANISRPRHRSCPPSLLSAIAPGRHSLPAAIASHPPPSPGRQCLTWATTYRRHRATSATVSRSPSGHVRHRPRAGCEDPDRARRRGSLCGRSALTGIWDLDSVNCTVMVDLVSRGSRRSTFHGKQLDDEDRHGTEGSG